ncbi:immunoglobulin superfamily member 23 [Cynocephalus volans]|uniref:immunoglobulin superfamily member 23 n=1 Tax=Cynocephalus volans TaxID=110931 RepID=UPI002FCBF1DB
MQVLAVASDSPNPGPLLTFPEAIHGIIQSDLNHSAILQRVVTMNPEAVLSWDLNGEPCGTGEKLFIWQLSWEHLGTCMCMAKNSEEQLFSELVTISLPHESSIPSKTSPVKPGPHFSLSGGSAISLLMPGILGATALIGGICFTIIQNQSPQTDITDNETEEGAGAVLPGFKSH